MPQGKIWPHSALGHQMLNSDGLADEYESILTTSEIIDGIVESLIFDLPLLTSVVPSVANDFTVTYPAAASVRTVFDNDGIIRRVNSGELRFEGARRVENLCDFNDVGDMASTNSGTGGTIVDNADGSITLGTPSSGDRAYITTQGIPMVDGARYMVSFEVVDVTGIGSPTADYTQNIIHVVVASVTYDGYARNIIDTSYRGRMAIPFVCTASGSGNMRIGLGTQGGVSTGGAEITIKNVQIEEISGKASDIPSEYIEPETDYDVGSGVTGVKNYKTELGNTWNSSTYAVTESVGAMIADTTLKGWLSEDTVSNDIPEVDFNNAAWSIVGVTQTAAEGPDGRGDACIITQDTSTGFHETSDIITHAIGATCTFSFYVRIDGTGTTNLRCHMEWSSGFARADWEVDGEGSLEGVGGTITPTQGMEKIDDNWFRVWMTATEGGLDSTCIVRVRHFDGATANFTGDGLQALRIWGPQFEQEGHVSSFIPFNGTRAADYNLGYAISNVLNDQGSMQVDITNADQDDARISASNYIIRGGATSARFCYRTSGTKAGFFIYDGTTAHSIPETWTYGQSIKYRVRWDAAANEFHHSSKPGSDPWKEKTLPAAYDGDFSFGANLELNQFTQVPGHMKNLKIWPTSKTAAWLTS